MSLANTITIQANCVSVSYGQQQTFPTPGQTTSVGTTLGTIGFAAEDISGTANGVTLGQFTLQFQNVTTDLGFFPGQTYTLTIN